jgi:predicted aspartyl protease
MEISSSLFVTRLWENRSTDGMNKNVRLEESVPATLHASTTQSRTSRFVLEGTLRGHRCRILVDSGASENFSKAEWVREHHIPTVSREKYPYRIKLAYGSTTTTRQRLRNEVLTVGTMDIRLEAIMTELDKFDIILF